MTDPHSLIDDLDRRTAEALQRAETAKAEIATLSGTATSEDGAATVTVNATGALLTVSFGRAADNLPKERLAEAVMSAARRAQTTAARRVTEVMTPLIGADSEAMRLLQEQLPAVEAPQPKHPAVTAYNEERETAARPPRAKPRPAPR